MQNAHIDKENILNTFKSWEETQAKNIICDNVSRWIKLTVDEIKTINRLHINPEIIGSQIHYLMSLILDILKYDANKNNSTENHHVLLASPLTKHIRTEYEDCVHPHWRNRLFFDDVYSSSEKIYSSIARHLRKTILKDHKTCIQRFVKMAVGPNFCPYAYAYVLWRKIVEGLDYTHDVHNRPVMSPRRFYPLGLDFITKIDVNYLRGLFRDCFESENYNKPPESIVATKWVLFHTMSHLLLYDFYGWLSEAESLIKQERLPKIQLFDHNYVPFYIVEVPIKNSGVFKFHWWTDRKNTDTNIPKCPFNTKRKKRDYRYETIKYIEHPVRAAMKKVNY